MSAIRIGSVIDYFCYMVTADKCLDCFSNLLQSSKPGRFTVVFVVFFPERLPNIPTLLIFITLYKS